MSNQTWRPWVDVHPDLTLERLTLLGSVFRSVWRRVSELHEPGEGDDMWAMSCRAFTRSGYRLKLVTQQWAWLSVAERKKMQLVLCVGVAPVRFYHGEPEEVPRRYASAPDAEKELRQGLLDFGNGVQDGSLIRIAVTTNAQGVPLSVALIKYDEETQSTLETFVIPDADASGATVTEFPIPQPKPGILLPKPSVRPRGVRVKQNAEDQK